MQRFQLLQYAVHVELRQTFQQALQAVLVGVLQRNRDVRALSGRFETNASVAGAIADIVVYQRPDDYVRSLKARIESQTDAGVRDAARGALLPAALTWVIVGDLRKIEQPIRDLQLGEVKVLDKDGQVVR